MHDYVEKLERFRYEHSRNPHPGEMEGREQPSEDRADWVCGLEPPDLEDVVEDYANRRGE